MNVTLNIQDDTLAEARAYADECGTTVNAVMRQAVDDFIEANRRKKALAEAVAAVEAMHGTIDFDRTLTRGEMNER